MIVKAGNLRQRVETPVPIENSELNEKMAFAHSPSSLPSGAQRTSFVDCRPLASAEATAFFWRRFQGPHLARAALRARAERCAALKPFFAFLSPARNPSSSRIATALVVRMLCYGVLWS